MTQAKIVATLGPASDSSEMIRRLIEAGADVFRINFSHGRADDHRRMARTVRSVAEAMGREVALLGDVAGPKIRCGDLPSEPVELTSGESVTLACEAAADTGEIIPITHSHFHDDVRVGQEIALDDGRLRLRVETIEGRRVICRVVEGGPLRSRKGVNLPDTELSIAAVTDDDRANIALAAEEGFDFIGLSFVGSADDVATARSILREHGSDMALIAKIERRSAVDQLEAILDAADGAMVARGDLGVELPIERVPWVQKQVIRECNRRAKPVITATQMLETMIHNRRPTRAEVADIANAILDGTDAVMLSGETAVGDWPAEAVRAMDRVARVADAALDRESRLRLPEMGAGVSDDAAIAQAAAELAHDLGLDAVVCLTESGSTARRIARHRPHCPIVATSTNMQTVRQLLLSWGVEPIFLPQLEDPAWIARNARAEGEAADEQWVLKEWTEHLLALCAETGRIRPSQSVVVVAGLPLGQPGTTNLIHLATVGNNE